MQGFIPSAAVHALLTATFLLAPFGCAAQLTSKTPKTVSPALRDALEPCKAPATEVDALCGSYQVWENRVTESGRKISLHLILVPAVDANPEPDPLFFFEGGPGIPATRAAGFLAQDLPRIHQKRDLVLIDQRGVAGPDALNCDLSGIHPAIRTLGIEGFLASPDAVQQCRDALSRNYDLRLYTTALAADDVDEIRQALSYEKINIFGLSYGTRLAAVYLRRHPESVRTVTVLGPALPPFVHSLYFARDAQRALDLLFDDCEADPACQRAFPDLAGDLQKALDRLPSYRGPDTGAASPSPAPESPALTKEFFATAIRLMLYDADTQARIPQLIHALAEGNDAPYLEMMEKRRGSAPGAGDGLFLSIVCTEDAARFTPEEIRRTTRGTFLGDFRATITANACRDWPAGEVPPGFHDPVQSDVPVLFLTGELDPVTPPAQARDSAAHFSNSLLVVAPKFAHVGNPRCLDSIFQPFVETSSVKNLDTSCAEEITRPAFLLP